jgi:hypothetical protein
MNNWKVAIKNNRFTTAKDVFNDTQLNHNDVSYRTVCRVLKEMGLLAHKQPKKFWLGGKNGIANRMKWATLMKDPGYFDSVIFSDECFLKP